MGLSEPKISAEERLRRRTRAAKSGTEQLLVLFPTAAANWHSFITHVGYSCATGSGRREPTGGQVEEEARGSPLEYQ